MPTMPVQSVRPGTIDSMVRCVTQIGLLLFPSLTQLDLTGPLEVFQRLPNSEVHLVWQSVGPVTAEHGLLLTPTISFDDCPQLDVLLVPGGSGIHDLLLDHTVLAFLYSQSRAAQWVTSVCTGSLVLGAAGLLRGYRATTHWAYKELLGVFGAIPAEGRVVAHGNRITGAGVSAGLDTAFVIAGELFGRDVAEEIQLRIEYAPAPPFQSGAPDTADPSLTARVREDLSPLLETRRTIAQQAALNIDRLISSVT